MLSQQDLTATEVAASFERPIVVSVMNKVTKYPFLQMLGYNAQLGYMSKDFLGLNDFYDELTTYSSSNAILQSAWRTIKDRVPFNLDLQTEMYSDPTLGRVGLPFLALIGFAQTFAVNPDQLLSSPASKVI